MINWRGVALTEQIIGVLGTGQARKRGGGLGTGQDKKGVSLLRHIHVLNIYESAPPTEYLMYLR